MDFYKKYSTNSPILKRLFSLESAMAVQKTPKIQSLERQSWWTKVSNVDCIYCCLVSCDTYPKILWHVAQSLLYKSASSFANIYFYAMVQCLKVRPSFLLSQLHQRSSVLSRLHVASYHNTYRTITNTYG